MDPLVTKKSFPSTLIPPEGSSVPSNAVLFPNTRLLPVPATAFRIQAEAVPLVKLAVEIDGAWM